MRNLERKALAGPLLAGCLLLAATTWGTAFGQIDGDALTLIKFLKANNDAYQGNRDAALTVAAPGVLTNDVTAVGTPTLSVTTDPANGTVTLNNDGSFTYTPTFGFGGVDSFTYQLSVAAVAGRGAKVASALVKITIPDAQGESAPLITSPLLSTGHVGVPFSYQLTALGTQPLFLDAGNLPGGFVLTGDTINATPSAAGQGNGALTAANTAGNALETWIVNVVESGPAGFLLNPPSASVANSNSDTDTDGDGFSDELENVVGTNANDANDTPVGTSAANALRELDLLKIQVKLNFAKPSRDIVKISGVVPVSGGLDPTSEGILFDVGGVVRAFTLDEKGRSLKATSSVKMKFSQTKGVINAGLAKFTLTIKKEDLVTGGALTEEGLTGDTDQKATPLAIPITVIFDDQVSINRFTGAYTSKTGKVGKYTFKL